jgi:hypothetical protein
MTDHPENDNSLEIARLRSLEETPHRTLQDAERGRARFLAEARTLRQAVSPSPVRRLIGWIEQIKTKEISVMKRSFGSAFGLATAAIVVVVLLGATVATGYAAQSALPGSPLHSVKTGLERAQLALSADAAGDARLNLQFAEKRLEELAGLIEAGRFNELSDVAQAFEAHIQAAIAGLGAVAQSDPVEAQELATAVTEALSRYASLLSEFAASVPTEAQAALLSALEVTNQGISLDDDRIDENENDNVDENLNTNENANENENENDNDDLNENDNDDLDENDNEDENENENQNENENDNEDENENQNDNENVNENDNENDNED